MSVVTRTPAPAPAAASLAVIIPTRNRADLAIRAVRSLLDQPGCRLQVFVSDNSTSADEQRRLTDFCRALADPRIAYMRPPTPLPMAEHWDWAMQQALARSDASHLTIHYDRKVSRPRHLGLLAGAAARHPNLLFTYMQDFVINEPPPTILYQPPWTGKVYQMLTERVLQLTARGAVFDMGQAFPIMSNCLIPRPVLEGIRERFGDICNSTGPDSCFTYRFCALNERYLHFDRPLAVIHASYRSNGSKYLRGKTDGDFGDFLKTWGDRPWLDAAPIPGINLGQNMLYHEYELVRRATGDARFPPIDMDGYLQELAAALAWLEDPRLRDVMRATLEEHGWREEPKPEDTEAAGAPDPLPEHAAEAPKARGPLYRRLSPRRLSASARGRVQTRWAQLRQRQDFVLFLADYLGIKPPHIHCFTFPDNDKALHYALTCPREPAPENPHIRMLEPSEVDLACA